MGFEAEIWAWRGGDGGMGRRRRRRRRRRRKFPYVKAKLIDPFRAAALLPPKLQSQPTKAGHRYR